MIPRPQRSTLFPYPTLFRSRVAIPYKDTPLPAYFSAAPATEHGPAPVVVLVNGLDSTKEHMYASNHWEELAARGISCLMLDQPGTGEALRLQGLTARIDTEAWAGAARSEERRV